MKTESNYKSIKSIWFSSVLHKQQTPIELYSMIKNFKASIIV